MALGLQAAQNFPGILGTARFDAVAVQHLQCIQHGGGVLGPVAAGQGTKRAADQLLAVRFRDQNGESRVFGRDVGEALAQGQPRHDVDHIAKVDALLRPQARLVAQRYPAQPVLEGFRLALVGHFEGRHLLFLQPLAHGAQEVLCLREVDRLGAAARRRGQIQSGSIQGQKARDLLVAALQAEEQLVGQTVVAELRRVEGLDEVEVEIPVRLGRRPVVGRPEEHRTRGSLL